MVEPNANQQSEHGGQPPVQISELGSRRLWATLRRSRLLEDASREIQPDPARLDAAWQSFCRKHGVDPASGSPVPAEFEGCPPGDLRAAVEREIRIAMWKNEFFAPAARDHFEQRKHELDRIVYSLLRTNEAGIARELWFRLKENEATFAELAPRYAQGNEVFTGGIVGPAPLGAMHPALAAVLRGAAPGELLKPFRVAEWFLVARVERRLPATFDEATKARVIEELANRWLEAKLHGTREA